MELRWNCQSSSWSLTYSSRRDVQTSLGSWFRRSGWNRRTAMLVFESQEQNVQVSLSGIVDEACSKSGGEPFRRSLGAQSYPLLTLDPGGRILRNFYPGNRTFPLVFVPALVDLRVGETTRVPLLLPLKSGFRRIPADGLSETRVEIVSSSVVRLRTTFEVETRSRGWLSGGKPTRMRGHSDYLFDVEQGKLLGGEAASELEQDITFFRFRESFQMKLGSPQRGSDPRGR